MPAEIPRAEGLDGPRLVELVIIKLRGRIETKEEEDVEECEKEVGGEKRGSRRWPQGWQCGLEACQ